MDNHCREGTRLLEWILMRRWEVGGVGLSPKVIDFWVRVVDVEMMGYSSGLYVIFLTRTFDVSVLEGVVDL